MSQLSTDSGVPSFYKLYRKALNNSLLYFYLWQTGNQVLDALKIYL
ncbi:hypothetical protein EMIT0P2_40462 [Pseudomonas sp. IT-P2]